MGMGDELGLVRLGYPIHEFPIRRLIAVCGDLVTKINNNETASRDRCDVVLKIKKRAMPALILPTSPIR